MSAIHVQLPVKEQAALKVKAVAKLKLSLFSCYICSKRTLETFAVDIGPLKHT